MSKFTIGWASRDISVDKPVSVPGQAHVRLNEGIIDPIYATALVLENDGDCVIFGAMDGEEIRPELVNDLRAKLTAERPDIPANKVSLNVTHAHTGASHFLGNDEYEAGDLPEDKMPIDRYDIFPSDDYRAFLVKQLFDAISEAWDGRKEGGMAYGYGYAVVAHSRRVLYFDDVSLRGKVDPTDSYSGVNGHGVMYGNTNDDKFDGYEAGADHFINIMYTFDTDGKLTGAVVNVPCPSQNSEGEWGLTASFWNETRNLIRQKYGNIFILPQCAAGGDLAPRILHYKQAQDRRFMLKYGMVNDGHEMAARMDIAERIASAFDEILAWAKKDIQTDVKVIHKVHTIHMEPRAITDKEYEDAKIGLAASRKQPFITTEDAKHDLVFNSTIINNRKRFLNVISRYEQQATLKEIPMELHTVRVGDIAFATNNFELYMDFQHRIQARSPFAQTFIIQLCGDPDQRNSYLCTERANANRGYSAITYSCKVSPKGGQQLVEETLKDLKELYNK